MLNTMVLDNIVKIVETWGGAMILDNIVKIVATWWDYVKFYDIR